MLGLIVTSNGYLNLKALELLGATTKNGINTIGMFGTGMKYAIASALRHGLQIMIKTGNPDGSQLIIRFRTKFENIGDEIIVERIVIDINDGGQVIETSMTTDLGKHDWCTNIEEGVSPEWQILREFISNALDTGCSKIILMDYEAFLQNDNQEQTSVFIEVNREIKNIYENLGEYFIDPNITSPIFANKYGEAYERSKTGSRIYCKGVFIRTINDYMLYNYNLKNLKLTESRTVDIWRMKYAIGQFISGLSAEELSIILKNLTKEPGNSSFEADLTSCNINIEGTGYEAFTQAFGNAISLPKLEDLPVAVLDAIYSCRRPTVRLPENWHMILTTYCGVDNHLKVITKELAEGLKMVADTDVEYTMMSEIIDAYQWVKDYYIKAGMWRTGLQEPELKFFTFVNPSIEIFGKCMREDGWIGINIDKIDGPISLRQTMLEEMAHYISGCSDFSRGLVEFLTETIVKHS